MFKVAKTPTFRNGMERGERDNPGITSIDKLYSVVLYFKNTINKDLIKGWGLNIYNIVFYYTLD